MRGFAPFPALVSLGLIGVCAATVADAAERKQDKGAVASCSRVLRCLIHGSITAIKDGFQLIGPEGLKTAWCCGIVLS